MTRKKFCLPLLSCLYGFSVWLSALLLAWILLAQVNFGYSVWYPLLKIDQFVQLVAPHEFYKPSFQWTTPAEHARLFNEISHAINHNGDGLANIRYYNTKDHIYETMLSQDEIFHLQDVAYLVRQGQWLGIGALFVYALSLVIFYRLKWKIPSIKNTLIPFFSALLTIISVILLLGPTRVFAQFHHWVFPVAHRWAFYYEESLMSLIMYAPKVFGYIAIALVILSSLLFISLLRINQLIYRREKE